MELQFTSPKNGILETKYNQIYKMISVLKSFWVAFGQLFPLIVGGAFIRINTVFYCIKYNVFQRMNQIVIDITSPTPTSFCSFIVRMKTGLERFDHWYSIIYESTLQRTFWHTIKPVLTDHSTEALKVLSQDRWSFRTGIQNQDFFIFIYKDKLKLYMVLQHCSISSLPRINQLQINASHSSKYSRFASTSMLPGD